MPWKHFEDVWERAHGCGKREQKAVAVAALAVLFVFGTLVFVALSPAVAPAAAENATATSTASDMISLIAQILPWIFVLGIFGYLMRIMGRIPGTGGRS